MHWTMNGLAGLILPCASQGVERLRGSDAKKHLVPGISNRQPANLVLRCAGQEDDAAALYNNYTGAWHTWGWMPELFSLDVTQVSQRPASAD